MTNCIKYQEMLSAYLDGALSAEEAEELDAHLQSCENCRALLEIYKAMHDSYCAEEPMMEEPPEELLSGVMSRIHKMEDISSPVPAGKIPQTKAASSHKKTWRNVAITFGSLAACLVLVMFSFSHFFGAKSEAPMDAADMAADSAAPESTTNSSAMDDTLTLSEESMFDDAAEEDIAVDDAADVPAADAPADDTEDVPSEGANESEPSLYRSATVTISGSLPEGFSSEDFTDLGDGTYRKSIDLTEAQRLEAEGYSVSYTEVSEASKAVCQIIWKP